MKFYYLLFISLFAIKGLTQDPIEFAGFFKYSYNPKDGKITLYIDKIDKEFLYVEALSSGVGSNDIGLDRGQIGRERIVKFKRMGNKILLIQPNYSYRAISNNPAERKAVEEGFAQSVLWGFTIDKEENGILSIDLSPFLLQDVHDVTGRLESSKQGSYRLDLTRSAMNMERTKNFPQNSEFDVLLTFTGKATGAFIRSVSPSAEAVTVFQHHSFVELPDDQYEPRPYDPRSGYYDISYFDYATPIHEPIQKRWTVRHRLDKKNPTAARSEAIKPLVYYIDPGCPEPIKSALMDGARWWNQAFEAAGYIDAFKVMELPAGADPLDVRFNMIQWIHRSTRGWSYGNTVTDPRTGEIIKGHVSLGSLRVRQDYLIAQGLASPFGTNDTNFGPMTEMALARLRQLAAHEVGHTLGIVHNYASSYNDRASVMDYPHPVVDFKDGQVDFSKSYTTAIGEWDKRAIIWGYQDFPAVTDQVSALNAIMKETLASGLKFLSDQDARPAGSAHPYSHLWDNGSSALDELNRIMKVRKQALAAFGTNTIRNGTPMASLENVLVPLYLSQRYQVEALSKWVGGVYYDYALKGDGQETNKMMPADQQLAAAKGILKSISPSELALPERIIGLIPPQPLGYDRDRESFKTYTGLVFDALSAAESMSGFALGFLLNSERLARLVEQNARDAGHIGINNYLSLLHKEIISQSAVNGLEQEIKLNNERIFILKILGLLTNASSATSVQAALLQFINKISIQIAGSSSTQNIFLNEMIKKFKADPSKFEAPESSKMPDGAPIGCDH